MTELSGLDDEFQISSIPPESFDLILVWDKGSAAFLDRTALVKKWLEEKTRLESGSVKLVPIVIESDAGVHLLRPASGAEGRNGSFTTTDEDASLIGPRMRISAFAVDAVRIRMAVRPTAGSFKKGRAELYWKGPGAAEFSESAKLTFDIVADGTTHEYVVKTGGTMAWLEAGVISQVRLDPVNFPAKVEIELFSFEPVSPR